MAAYSCTMGRVRRRQGQRREENVPCLSPPTKTSADDERDIANGNDTEQLAPRQYQNAFPRYPWWRRVAYFQLSMWTPGLATSF